MADRIVRVRLSAQVQEYQKAMMDAANSTRTVGSEADKLAAKKQAFEQLGRAGVTVGALLATGFGIAVAKAAEFDEALSHVQASTHESADNMELLRDAAIEAGASTVFSATESANAIEELAKAGLSTADILGGALKGSLDLAAAGGLGVAEAAEIAATTLQQFRLDGSEASHVADLLAAGAGKAMGDVTDMGQALNQAGLVSNQFGVSIEETVGVLSAFASAGMLGSDAGTSMRSMLLRLANPTEEVKELMAGLGIEAYNSQGQFIGLAGLAGELEGSLHGMTDAQRDQTLAMIFGQDAIRGANILLREGEDGIRDWTAAVDDQGYAAETAAMRLDNLKGDLEALSGAMDSALIETGSAGNDALRAMVQTLTMLVDGYNDLPEPVKATVLAVGGATAAVALAGGTALLAVPKFIQFRAAMTGTSMSMKGVSLSAGAAGLALGGLFAIVGSMAAAHAEAKARAEAYASTLEAGSNRVTSATRDMAKEALAAKDSFLWMEKDSAYDAATELGVSLDLVTDAATGNAAALKELEQQIEAGSDGSLAYANASETVKRAIAAQSDSIDAATKAEEQKNQVTDEGVAVTESAADAYLAAADGVSALESQLQTLIDTVMEANGVGQDAVSSNLDYQDALAGVDEVIRQARDGVEGYALTLDENTQAGRDNLGMLNDLAGKSQAAAEAQFALDGNTDNYRQTLENGRQAVIDRAEALGYNADQAQALADKIYAIPNETEWKVIADTASAHGSMQAFWDRWDNKQVTVHVKQALSYAINSGSAGGIPRGSFPDSANGNLFSYEAFSDGGFASGIYAGRAGGIQKFAEPETGWEAFISGKPAARDRNIGIWQETGRRLGADAAGPVQVSFPDTVTLVDQDGSILARARVVADQQINQSKYKAAVKLSGGSASA